MILTVFVVVITDCHVVDEMMLLLMRRLLLLVPQECEKKAAASLTRLPIEERRHEGISSL